MNLRRSLGPLSLLAAMTAAAVPALAQDESADTQETPEVQVSDVARRHFKAGVAFLTDPDGARYEEAYAEFRSAYGDSPSWKILGNLGLSAMKLERDGEAIEAFEKYLAEGGERIDPGERAQMERDLATTKAGVAWVTLESSPPGGHFVDERAPVSGRPTVNRYDAAEGPQRLGVRRGHHKFTARLDGHEDAVWEVDLEPGQDYANTFEMKVPPEEPAPTAAQQAPTSAPDQSPQMERPIPIPVYITAGVTGALLVGAGVTGFMALGKKSDYDQANDGVDPAAAEDVKGSGETLNLVTDILLGGAVVGGVVTTVLFVTRPEVPAEKDTALAVRPLVGPTGGALSVSGRF